MNAVLAGWTASDRAAFACWYRSKQNAQRTEFIQKQKAQIAMQPASYIDHLKAVDFRRIDSITTFIHQTQVRDWDPYPMPIVLGSEKGIVYQLCSQLLDLEPSFDLPAGATASGAITGIQSPNPDTKLSLQFVLPLDTLEYSQIADSSRAEIPFQVCVNAIDRSIWLVLSPYTLDDLGDRETISRGTDPWPYLGLHSDSRVQFDVMELMTWEEFQNLVEQSQALKRDMFGLAKVAMQVWPSAWVASNEAMDAVVSRTIVV